MVKDALDRNIVVGDFVFHHGRVYKVYKVNPKKSEFGYDLLRVNNARGWQLMSLKSLKSRDCCLINSEDVLPWILKGA
jgi:hypothetical protein